MHIDTIETPEVAGPELIGEEPNANTDDIDLMNTQFDPEFGIQLEDGPIVPQDDNPDAPQPEAAPEEEAKSEDPETEPLFKVDGDAIIIKGQRIEGDQLEAAAEAALNYTANQQKFRAEQQAWEQQRTQQVEEMQPLIQAANWIGGLPPESQEVIFNMLDEVGKAAQRGEVYQPSAPMAAQAPDGKIEIPGYGEVDFDELSGEGQAILTYTQRRERQLSEIIAKQNQLLANLETRVKQYDEVLPDVKSTLTELRGDKEAQVAAEQIKSKYGVEVTPAELRAIQKENGVNNLEAAYLLAKGGTAAKPESTATRRPPQTPTGQGRPVQIGTKTPDQIFAELRASGQG